jgi:hypothetical protein
VPRAPLQRQFCADITSELIKRKTTPCSCGCGEQQQSVETARPSMGKADNNSDPCDRLSAWLLSCVLQNGQNPRGLNKGQIVECNRTIGAVKKNYSPLVGGAHIRFVRQVVCCWFHCTFPKSYEANAARLCETPKPRKVLTT